MTQPTDEGRGILSSIVRRINDAELSLDVAENDIAYAVLGGRLTPWDIEWGMARAQQHYSEGHYDTAVTWAAVVARGFRRARGMPGFRARLARALMARVYTKQLYGAAQLVYGFTLGALRRNAEAEAAIREALVLLERDKKYGAWAQNAVKMLQYIGDNDGSATLELPGLPRAPT